MSLPSKRGHSMASSQPDSPRAVKSPERQAARTPGCHRAKGNVMHDGLDQILTVAEVAQLLRVQPSWVYERTRGRSADRLPFVKLGKIRAL